MCCSIKSFTKSRFLGKVEDHQTIKETVVFSEDDSKSDVSKEELSDQGWFIIMPRSVAQKFDQKKIIFVGITEMSMKYEKHFVVKIISFDEKTKTSLYIGTYAFFDKKGYLALSKNFSPTKYEDVIKRTKYDPSGCWSVTKAYTLKVSAGSWNPYKIIL